MSDRYEITLNLRLPVCQCVTGHEPMELLDGIHTPEGAPVYRCGICRGYKLGGLPFNPPPPL